MSSESPDKHIRLNAQQIGELVNEFHEHRSQGKPRASRPASERRIEIFLAYLASGGYYRQVAYTYGVATSTASDYLHEVSDFMMDRAPNYIKLPQPEEYQDLSSPLTNIGGRVTRVILYIDGLIVRIQRPAHAGDAYYCGRAGKACDSINVQYVVDKRGIVRHVVSGLSGATHDKTAIEWSQEFMDYLDGLPDDVVVLGDPAYRNLHPRVTTTFTGRNLTREQQAFNGHCTRLRQIVERSIGATELKWRMDQHKENRYAAKGGPLFAAKCTISICALHNHFTNFL
ncbi:uncharacterized protein LOC135497675 [Lineus longissimus]|uniref:uncharacterized protein LOC135497675 n=1 Tax=Lineus longissimus TaxID=88925 RepID=UPI00315D0806